MEALSPLVTGAAVNATHVLLNGGTNTTVEKGDTVETRVTYTATAGEDIESMSVEDVGSGIPAVCVDVPDQINSGTYHVILNDWPTVDGRNMDAPGFAGSWNRRIRLYGVDGSGADQQCNGAVRDTLNSAGQLTVKQTATPIGTPVPTATPTPTPTATPTATPAPAVDLHKLVCVDYKTVFIGTQLYTSLCGATGGGTASDIHIDYDLSYGMRGSEVVELQSFLIANGYSIPAGATGNFLSQTRDAVRSFQAQNGISPTGYVGSVTRAKINAATQG